MRYPSKDRPRGQSESLEHYLLRLTSYKAEVLQQSSIKQSVDAVSHIPWKYFSRFAFNRTLRTVEDQLFCLSDFLSGHRNRKVIAVAEIHPTFFKKEFLTAPCTLTPRDDGVLVVEGGVASTSLTYHHIHLVSDDELRPWPHGPSEVQGYRGIGALYYLFSKIDGEFLYFGDIDFKTSASV